MLGILNLFITLDIVYHDTLYGFLEGQGMGTASLNTKILQNLVYMREEVLYDIFLDIYKDDGALDR